VVSTNDLTALLRLYNITDPRRTRELVNLARAARQQSWRSAYRDTVSPTFFQYIEYEASASILRQYEPILIPGLLQTRNYAQAVVSRYRRRFSASEVGTAVELRMKAFDY
jgi:hypothetical protein